LLRRSLNVRIGRSGLPFGYTAKLWAASVAGAIIAWIAKLALPPLSPIPAAIVILGGYGGVFLLATFALRIPEASSAVTRLLRR
jgi:putative peptidoglycan lipid II flippase